MVKVKEWSHIHRSDTDYPIDSFIRDVMVSWTEHESAGDMYQSHNADIPRHSRFTNSVGHTPTLGSGDPNVTQDQI